MMEQILAAARTKLGQCQSDLVKEERKLEEEIAWAAQNKEALANNYWLPAYNARQRYRGALNLVQTLEQAVAGA